MPRRWVLIDRGILPEGCDRGDVGGVHSITKRRNGGGQNFDERLEAYTNYCNRLK